MASVFQRTKGGSWWIKYYVHGRQVYHTLGTKDARVAIRAKREIEAQEVRGELLAPPKTPLAAFLEDFRRFLSTIRTRKGFSSDLSVLRIFFIKVSVLEEVTASVICRRHYAALMPEKMHDVVEFSPVLLRLWTRPNSCLSRSWRSSVKRNLPLGARSCGSFGRQRKRWLDKVGVSHCNGDRSRSDAVSRGSTSSTAR